MNPGTSWQLFMPGFFEDLVRMLLILLLTMFHHVVYSRLPDICHRFYGQTVRPCRGPKATIGEPNRASNFVHKPIPCPRGNFADILETSIWHSSDLQTKTAKNLMNVSRKELLSRVPPCWPQQWLWFWVVRKRFPLYVCCVKENACGKLEALHNIKKWCFH